MRASSARFRSNPWPFVVGCWLLALACLAILLLTSCATYQAVTEAPAEFWITAEEIVLAVLADIWSVLEWVF